MNEQELRTELVRVTKKLDALGLSHGTSGNLSAHFGEGFLITPSGFGAEGLTEEDIVFVEMSGQSHGRWQPSSEWLFHRDIYAQRPEFGAVVHTHSQRGDGAGLSASRHPVFSLHAGVAGRR